MEAEYLPAGDDFAYVQLRRHTRLVDGPGVRTLNSIFSDPTTLLKVPLDGKAYAFGVWNRRPPRLELIPGHEEYDSITGTVAVYYWKRVWEGDRYRDKRIRVEMPVSKLEVATLKGYKPEPFRSTTMVMTNEFDEPVPLQLVGLQENYLVGVPSSEVAMMLRGARKWDTIHSFSIPLRLVQWRDTPFSEYWFPPQLDRHFKSFLFTERTFDEAFIPNAENLGRDMIKKSLLTGGPLPSREILFALISEQVSNAPQPERTVLRWLHENCFQWLLGEPEND